MCVLVPDWPLEVARRAALLPPEGPAAVWYQGFVVAASPEARLEGVRVGQKRREAEALCPVMVMMESDPGAETAAFESVAVAVESLVPRLEIAEPGLAWVSAAGALRYYGGAQATAAAVYEAARAGAPTVRVGLARGPFAARQAALNAPGHPPVLVLEAATEAGFLAPLPVTVLDDPFLAASLRRVGIHTLGDLAALPRPAVVARFGGAGVRAHRLAHGDDRLPAPRVPSEDLSAEMAFEPPLTDTEAAAFAARSLAAQLATGLESQGLSAFAVEVSGQTGGGPAPIGRGELSPPDPPRHLRRTWRALDPLDERGLSDRARWQVAAWADAGLLPEGLALLRLAPLDVSGTGRQLSLLSDAAADADAARAYTRIQALLGPDAVRRAVLQGGRGPDDRHRFIRHGEPDPGPPAERPLDAPWPGGLPAPAPALVLPRPQPVEVDWAGGAPRTLAGEEVESWAGPWRRREAWWDDARARDLEWWQLVTATGARLVARSSDGWTVCAIYD